MTRMTEDVFIIEGLSGKRSLKGEIFVNGAKNDTVQAIAAALLFGGGVHISNVPDIEDKKRMLELVSAMGAIVKESERGVFIDATKLKNPDISPEISKMIRASIILIGPVLARFGKVSFPHPGGCVIGARPIDFFLEGLSKMGAKVFEEDKFYRLEAKNGLRGAEIFFRKPSVTATETMIMAGVLAKGRTVLKNCPTEPEIGNLIIFLKSAGAKIEGLGTSTITIEGQKDLLIATKNYDVLPDRIEAGSFIILGALAGKDVKVSNCVPEHVLSLISFLEYSGVNIEVGKDFVRVLGANKKLKPLSITTHEYPGFPTDLQAPMSIFLTQAEGVSHIFETIYEGRLSYLDTLNIMGANTSILNPHQAVIEGKTPLKGREVKSPDLRAGLAYVLAGVIARGKTLVHNVYYIDRGYESVEKRLQKLGVKIKRVKHKV